MSNHMAQTWNHRGSKPFSLKFLPLDHYLNDSQFLFLFFLLLATTSIKYVFPTTLNLNGIWHWNSIIKKKNFFFVLIIFLFLILWYEKYFLKNI
jgi:hypothetical protein